MVMYIFSHVFFFLPWSKKSVVLQSYWLDLVGIYHYAKNYQIIPDGMAILANRSRTDGQVDRRTDNMIIGHYLSI